MDQKELQKRVLFFTGAGISAASGIPTFTDQAGIREKLTRGFANTHPEEYTEVIRNMKRCCDQAEPNAAHLAIAQYDFPVITMNIDRLHTRAGSRDVLEVHGVLPTDAELNDPHFAYRYHGIVLYDDMAPRYATAYDMVRNLKPYDSYFVIVGTSFYTNISCQLRSAALARHSNVLVIDHDAEILVPQVCQSLDQWIQTGISPGLLAQLRI